MSEESQNIFTSMQTYLTVVLRRVQSKPTKMEPTGSRVICPSMVTKEIDYDLLVKVPRLDCAVQDLVDLGFVGREEGDDEDDNKQYNGGKSTKFYSLRRENWNLLVTDNQHFYDDFMLATRTATKLNLCEKSQRILLFQAILYGNG